MLDKAINAEDPITIVGTEYKSRLLVGTGKYKDLDETRQAIERSGAEIVTVAIGRANRFRAWDPQPLQHTYHNRECQRSNYSRRGRRYGI